MKYSNYLDTWKIQGLRKPIKNELGGVERYETRDEAFSDRERFEPLMTFSDKASYLAWREEWLESIKDLSGYQRELRKVTRTPGIHSEEQSKLSSNSQYIHFLLALRKHSKVKANELYELERVVA